MGLGLPPCECTGERISRIGAGQGWQAQMTLHHDLNLLLAGTSGAHHRLLDAQRCELVDGKSALGECCDRGAPGLTEGEGGPRVHIDEDPFDHGLIRMEVSDQFLYSPKDLRQAGWLAAGECRPDGSASDIADLLPLGIQHAKACASQAGINAEDAHGEAENAGGSMTKVPHTGQHHGDAAFICSRNYLIVAYRSARLDHACGAGVGHGIQTVAKGEECIGRDN